MRQTTPQPARHPHPTAKVTKLAHLIFHRPDMGLVETFLRDFGLTVVERSQERILARAADESPYCCRGHRAREERFAGSGCALRVPSPAVVKLLGLLPAAKRWEVFGKSQADRPYLQPGDAVEASITSRDGRIDLGVQRDRIVDGSQS